ncbi:MAG TPA: protein arginine kinase [Kiritimatiellia bacterium]|nr:protein arginine kinase [Kiritimatiellia bacterium]HMO97660.1 protein arginine kinase [Kiritimatiellia bacterium]HMP95521.1 protein arginine kinase [Kiritimatiellia bacterium]
MTIDPLLSNSGAWMSASQHEQIVISSRIRLARNLRDYAFPGWGGEEECARIWSLLRPALAALPSLQPEIDVGMDELDDLDKQILLERHLISREQAGKGRGSGLIIREDERVSLMVNEEDHLRLQALTSGLDLPGCWRVIDDVDSQIESVTGYAFSPSLGYLTSCPTNVGTGMRASVMMHLPGLVLMEEMNPIIKGLGKIGLTVRGLWGEGTEAVGNMFQISNQMTLGEKEGDIVHNIEQICLEIVEHEKNARLRLAEKKELYLKDHIGRAFGILTHAHLLTTKEALDLLSDLRLGVDLGILKGVDRGVVDELLMMAQPGHLQKLEGRVLKTKERDRVRAKRVRERLTRSESRTKKVNKTHE